jgi:hypothetical protein
MAIGQRLAESIRSFHLDALGAASSPPPGDITLSPDEVVVRLRSWTYSSADHPLVEVALVGWPPPPLRLPLITQTGAELGSNPLFENSSQRAARTR